MVKFVSGPLGIVCLLGGLTLLTCCQVASPPATVPNATAEGLGELTTEQERRSRTQEPAIQREVRALPTRITIAQKHLERFQAGEALKILDEFVLRNPRDARGYYYRARAHLMAQRFETAAKEARSAVSLAPENAENRRLMGVILLRQDKSKQAASEFSSAIELAGESYELLLLRATAHQKDGHLRRALDDYDRAISLDPTGARGYRFRARVKTLLGDSPGAADDRKRFLELRKAQERP